MAPVLTFIAVIIGIYLLIGFLAWLFLFISNRGCWDPFWQEVRFFFFIIFCWAFIGYQLWKDKIEAEQSNGSN